MKTAGTLPAEMSRIIPPITVVTPIRIESPRNQPSALEVPVAAQQQHQRVESHQGAPRVPLAIEAPDRAIKAPSSATIRGNSGPSGRWRTGVRHNVAHDTATHPEEHPQLYETHEIKFSRARRPPRMPLKNTPDRSENGTPQEGLLNGLEVGVALRLQVISSGIRHS